MHLRKESSALIKLKHDHPKLYQAARLYRLALKGLDFLVVIVIALDAIINSWTLNDYLGNGHFFVTPVATVRSLDDLSAKYTFAEGGSYRDLSEIGQWMANLTIANMVTKSDSVYAVSASEYPLTPNTVLCPIFVGSYAVDLSKKAAVKLAVAADTTTFYRGNALSHAFTSDQSTRLATRDMNSTQLRALGYVPGRTQTDLRFTREFVVRNTSAPQSLVVAYYRICPRTFCTGCDPVSEMGFSSCNLAMVYDDAKKTLTVTNATVAPDSTYALGLMMPRSSFGVVALWAKLGAIFFAVGGYLASRRTVQWIEVDVTKTTSLWTRLVRTVGPKYFPHPSHAIPYAMFCYNSDIFVFLYSGSVLFDIQNCLIFIRNVHFYNSWAPQFTASFQTFSLATRLLWLNCAFLKVAKILWNLVGSASYSGESRLMGLFNLSSVTSLYVSAILLFYVPPFIEYNNGVTVDLSNSVERLDGLRVDVFESYYMRCVTSIAVGLVANVILVATLDHAVNQPYWATMAKNSLARQAIYNSSSILCDYLYGVEADPVVKERTVMVCRARRLSTLQWFFMSHMMCFGLPEKELRAKKKQMALTTAGGASVTSDSGSDGLYMVVQDGDRHVHLIDEQLADVTSLVYNIKVLKNTTISVR
ncbi:hypothetical protein ACHHYP_09561 [Achlya hypogyna]|uniref:Transmembrane protein n=1 Tax=Achlya hypogyna TaxID=1202772 RepID=A0A1V9YMY0_ACHHY|nr:hypothetical protein ACHHYP_09561 [Achlya hypogyna]